MTTLLNDRTPIFNPRKDEGLELYRKNELRKR